MKSDLVYIALLHYPVYNKHGEVVTTTITNFDLHDISRLARTYGLGGFYVVNPLRSQHLLARRIIDYWQEGYGASFNPTRIEAFRHTTVVSDLTEAIDQLRDRHEADPVIVMTGAKKRSGSIGYSELKGMMAAGGGPYLILFGTGWGIHASMAEEVDYILEPLMPHSDYNHLSVRSAASIIIDRLLGDRD
jgi:hypothetical protein